MTAKRCVEGAQKSTINLDLTCLKRMYNLANKSKEAKKNPVTKVNFLEEPPGRTRFLSSEEAQLLIKCCSNPLRPIVYTALHTGMRLEKILSLPWDRVYIDAAIDPYLELDSTKNNKKRSIPLNNDMIELLKSISNNN